MFYPLQRAKYSPLAIIASLFFVAPVFAQENAAQPSPADARAPVVPASYQSPFSGYQAWEESQPIDWRTANAAVAEDEDGGGHADHGASNDSASSAPTPALKNPHAGHNMQHGGMK